MSNNPKYKHPADGLFYFDFKTMMPKIDGCSYGKKKARGAFKGQKSVPVTLKNVVRLEKAQPLATNYLAQAFCVNGLITDAQWVKYLQDAYAGVEGIERPTVAQYAVSRAQAFMDLMGLRAKRARRKAVK